MVYLTGKRTIALEAEGRVIVLEVEKRVIALEEDRQTIALGTKERVIALGTKERVIVLEVEERVEALEKAKTSTIFVLVALGDPHRALLKEDIAISKENLASIFPT